MAGSVCVWVEHLTRVLFPATRRKHPRRVALLRARPVVVHVEFAIERLHGAFGGSPKAALGSSAPPGVALPRPDTFGMPRHWQRSAAQHTPHPIFPAST